MKKYMLFLFFCAVSAAAFPKQLSTADSLKNVLAAHAAEDTFRVELLIQYGEALWPNDLIAAIGYTDSALATARRIGWQEGIMMALRQEGFLYHKNAEHVKSLEYSFAAEKEALKVNDTGFIVTLYNNIGLVYMDIARYDKALIYFRRLLDVSRQSKSTYGEIMATLNMGYAYMKKEDFPLAEQYFRECVALAEAEGYDEALCIVFNNLGIILHRRKDYDDALGIHRKALEISRRIGNKYLEGIALQGIGDIYLHKKNYDQAEFYTKKALEINKSINLPESLLYTYEALSDIYKFQGKHALALDAYKQHIRVRDSIMNTNKSQEIVQKEMQFEFEKKEALLHVENDKRQALSAAEIKRQRIIRNTSIIGGIALMIVGGIIVMLYKINRDADEQKREADFRSLVSETEMKALRAQMNPHFIFNSLNSINDYIARHDTETATLYTTKFARLMRIVLENSEHREVSLADDLKALELYMQLEALRMGRKMQYDIAIDPEIDPEHTFVPPLLLQPFVENAIWHGIAHKKEGGHITITIGQQGGMLYCSVQDNGIGRKQSELINAGKATPGKKSLGMKITSERIQIINRVKNAQAEVHFEDVEEGTLAVVKLPLEKGN